MAKNIKIHRILDRSKQKIGRKCFGVRIKLEGQKPISKFFNTQLEREDWITDWKDELNDGVFEVTSKENKTNLATRTLHWAIDQYLKDGERKGWRNDTLRTREQRLNRMGQFLGDVGMKSITRQEVIKFIEEAGTNTLRQTWCNDVVCFFNWCGNEDQGRKWVPPYHFSKLKWSRLKEDETTVGILYPDEVEDLLGDILEKYRAGFALAFFAGIRPMGELDRLRWDDINFRRERIIIEGKAAKTRKRRVLSDLPANLWAWLEKYKKGKGPVIHSYPGFHQARRRACKRLEIKYPPDGARHSFASYGYWRGEEWCRRTMGHTQTSDVFHRVYVDAGPTKEESEEFFGILP